MTLSEREQKILDLADAWKLAHEIKGDVWLRFDTIDCWSMCDINFDDNADLTMIWKIERKPHGEIGNKEEGDRNDE